MRAITRMLPALGDGEAPVEDEQVSQVHEARAALAAEDPEKANLVWLRFFGGLSHEEIAALFGVSEKTVRRHSEVAKLWRFQASETAK